MGRTSGVVSRINVRFNPQTQAFEIPQVDPSSLRSEVYYERDSGKDKVLVSVPAKSALPAFSTWKQLQGQFSYLLAVDTNTVQVGSRRLSVSFSYAVPGKLSAFGGDVPFDPLCAYAIFDASPAVNPERIGWHLLLSAHVVSSGLSSVEQVAVVVDSDFGALSAINARTAPYYHDFLLPKNVTLAYASSDASSSTIPGDMLRYCDRCASESLEYLRPRLSSLPPPSGGDLFHAGHLLLDFKRDA